MGDSLVEVTADVVRRLDALLERLERQERQSTDLFALLRGSLNHMLYAGMFAVGQSLQARVVEGQVPFRALAFADVNGIGPCTFDVGGTGAVSGVGTVAARLHDCGCMPLVGRSLTVTSTTAGSLFVALYTTAQPFSWSSL